MHVATLSFFGVASRSISDLRRSQPLRILSNSELDIFSGKLKRAPLLIYAPKRNMDVRILCVVMLRRNPFQRRAEIAFHFQHQIPNEFLQIEPVAELRRDDQFEKPTVASQLPLVKRCVDRNAIGRPTETLMTTRFLMRRGRARDVPAVPLPLAWSLVGGVCNSNGTTLLETARLRDALRTVRTLSGTGHARDVHHPFEGDAPYSCFVRRISPRLRWP